MANIIAAHDLSGVGRCSLTTALAVIPAFGHTCYPLPTAVLSQQTNLPDYSFLDFTPHLDAYLTGWNAVDVSPGLIYTGFLGDGAQAEKLAEFIANYPNATVVIDPVMGDDGKLYECYGEVFAEDMKKLAQTAHILLPNATEFNLLTGRNPADALPQSPEEIIRLARGTGAPKLQYIVITSAVYPALFPHGMCNLIVDLKAETVTGFACYGNGVSYNGAGDLFASVVVAMLLDGRDIVAAVQCAARFVSRAIDMMPSDADPRYGIRFEPLLAQFAHEENESHYHKKENQTKQIAFAGMFAALIFLATFLFHIPAGIGGGYVHVGDALVYLAAAIFPAPFAMLAAAIGAGFSDLMTPGAAAWVLPTVIIKSLCCLPFSNKSARILCKRNVLGMIAAGLITMAGYCVATAIIYSNLVTAIAEIPINLVQSVGSAICFVLLAAALDRANIKRVIGLKGK